MAIIVIFLGLLGLAMGSFVDAMVWRLRTKRNMVTDRSECEQCHHKLGVGDLIPVFSWLFLRGKCRYCQAPISARVPLIELSLGILFVVSYLFWPMSFETLQAGILFGFWLVYLVLLAILFVYDLRWMLLPDKIVFPLIALGLIDAALRVSQQGGSYLLHVGAGMAVLAGLYGALYVVSKGRWVGFGDVKLGIFMGAVLGWQGALLVLALANIIGFFVVYPGLLMGKLTRKSRVPFGPFLIIAFLIAGIFGQSIISWYTNTFLLVGL